MKKNIKNLKKGRKIGPENCRFLNKMDDFSGIYARRSVNPLILATFLFFVFFLGGQN
jgi:hypothetical protein